MNDAPIPEDIMKAAEAVLEQIFAEATTTDVDDNPCISGPLGSGIIAAALVAERERTARVVTTMPSRYGALVMRDEAVAAIRKGSS